MHRSGTTQNGINMSFLDPPYCAYAHKMKLTEHTSFMLVVLLSNNWFECFADQPNWGLNSNATDTTWTIKNVESWEVCGMYCHIDPECWFWTWILPNHPDMFVRMDCRLKTSDEGKAYCTQQPWCEYVSGKTGCYSLYTC